MTDRADELAQQTAERFHILDPLPAFPDAQTFLPSAWEMVCLAEHRRQVAVIAATLRAYAEEARREEREACAKLVEDHGHSNGRIRASHKHLAAAIRARGEKE